MYESNKYTIHSLYNDLTPKVVNYMLKNNKILYLLNKLVKINIPLLVSLVLFVLNQDGPPFD